MSNQDKAMSDKMLDVEYQVCIVQPNNGWAGFYNSWNNSIRLNFDHAPDSNDINNIQTERNLIHEQKHRDNALQGMHIWPVNAEQSYKLNMHDEISANIAELLFLRQKYLETKDISLFDRGILGFYKFALLRGDINPASPYQEDFDKEMRLIANEIKGLWSCISIQNYNQQLIIHEGGRDFDGKYAKYHDQNYEKCKKIAYNIGGVDFTQYMDKDIEIPQEGKEALEKAVKFGGADNWFERFLAHSCNFFGLTYAQKVRIIRNSQEKNVFKKINAILDSTFYAFAHGLSNRIDKLFNQIAPPKNQPISLDALNVNDPQYKNSDSSENIDIRHAKIPDMTKNIVIKPLVSIPDNNVSDNNERIQKLRYRITADSVSENCDVAGQFNAPQWEYSVAAPKMPPEKDPKTLHQEVKKMVNEIKGQKPKLDERIRAALRKKMR